MNREYKFRAWDEQQNRFLRPSEIFSRMLIDDETGKFFIGGIVGKDWHEPKLMQYTGLKDKNGAEIYEGDIVKAVDYDNWELGKGIVKFYNGCFIVQGEPVDLLKDLDVEVIGNIYENKELLND